MKLTNAQIATLRAILTKSDDWYGTFVFGPFGVSAHSLANKGLLERKHASEVKKLVPGAAKQWQWGFRPTPAGRAALDQASSKETK